MSFSLSSLGIKFSHLGDQDDITILDTHPGFNLLLEDGFLLLLEDGISALLLEP